MKNKKGRKVATKGMLGKNKNCVAIGEWEDIPEADKHRVARNHYDGHGKMPIKSDMASALAKAQAEALKKYNQ